MSVIQDLTSFEVAQAEAACGIPYQSLADKAAAKVGLWGALAWQHCRRAEPELTYEAFMKSHTPDQVLAILYPDDTEDETAEVDEDGFPDSEGGSVGAGDAEPAGATGDDEGGVLSGDGGPAE